MTDRNVLSTIALLFLLLLIVGCGTASPPMAPPILTPLSTATLYCGDCAEEGNQAEVFDGVTMSRLRCRLEWGDTVDVLERSQENGGMAHIRFGSCNGWIRASLLK